MIAYLDSSVALRHILNGEVAIQQAMALGRMISSELLELECRRSLFRQRLEKRIGDGELAELGERLESILAMTSLVSMTEAVKRRAMGPFPVHVKTLDAIHLATALVLQDRMPDEVILVFSHDTQLNRAARLLGFGAPFQAGVG